MPETPVYGFSYETPQSKPGTTLTGDADGSTDILAEEVELVVSGIDARVTANTGDVAALQSSTPTDTGWQSLSITPASGWAESESIARQWGPIISIRVQLQRTGSPIVANSVGNVVGDPEMFFIDAAGARPDREQNTIFQASVTSGACTLFANGNVVITDAHTNSTIDTDNFVRVTHTYFTSTFV